MEQSARGGDIRDNGSVRKVPSPLGAADVSASLAKLSPWCYHHRMAYEELHSGVQVQVAARIKELMRENNLTQVALAKGTGLRQNTVSAWLLGKKEPSIRSLWLLADYFNVDIDYLVGRKDY